MYLLPMTKHGGLYYHSTSLTEIQDICLSIRRLRGLNISWYMPVMSMTSVLVFVSISAGTCLSCQ